MDILDDMGVSKLSAKVFFFKVNNFFKGVFKLVSNTEDSFALYNGRIKMFRGSFITWKTFGADTRQAKAEERVAPKMPALIRGATADTRLIV